MQESDTHDQHGHNPSSPWDDHWLIAALLALGMVWVGVSLADVRQPTSDTGMATVVV